MGKGRVYGSGVEKALFLLSRGTCYEPTCKTPVLRMTQSGTPRVNVQIAHIYPLGENEARYDPKHRSGLNRFANLLLVCQTHHTEVDSDLWTTFYQADVLFAWKATREGDLEDALKDVPSLQNDEQLETVFLDAIAAMQDQILTAIDRVEGISSEVLGLLKDLVAESFARPYLSEDSVASLEYSARVFDGMGDQTVMLYESARGLRGIEDQAWMLRESSHGLRHMPDYSELLIRATRELGPNFGDYVTTLAEAARQLAGLSGNAQTLLRAANQLTDADLPNSASNLAQLHDAVSGLQSATASVPELTEATRSIEAASYHLESVEGAHDWSWRSFQWGAVVCFILVVGLLVLWTFAIK